MRYIIFVLFLCTACQSGLIPCPRVKTAKIKRTNFHSSFYESLSAKNDDQADNIHYKTSKGADGKSIQNVSVEEWDCPRPGSKKYLPKSVRDNIKKNMKKIESGSANKATSTVGTNK